MKEIEDFILWKYMKCVDNQRGGTMKEIDNFIELKY